MYILPLLQSKRQSAKHYFWSTHWLKSQGAFSLLRFFDSPKNLNTLNISEISLSSITKFSWIYGWTSHSINLSAKLFFLLRDKSFGNLLLFLINWNSDPKLPSAGKIDWPQNSFSLSYLLIGVTFSITVVFQGFSNLQDYAIRNPWRCTFLRKPESWECQKKSKPTHLYF